MSTLNVDKVLNAAGSGPTEFTQGLEVTAGKAIQGWAISQTTVSATFTMSTTDGIGVVYVSNDTVAADVILPDASANANRYIKVHKKDANQGLVRVRGAGSDLVGSSASFDFNNQFDHVGVQSDGSNWNVLDFHVPPVLMSGLTGTGMFSMTQLLGSVNSLTIPKGRYVCDFGACCESTYNSTTGSPIGTQLRVASTNTSTSNILEGGAQPLNNPFGADNVSVISGFSYTDYVTVASQTAVQLYGNGTAGTTRNARNGFVRLERIS